MKGRKFFFITVCFLLLRYGSLFRSLLNLNNNNNNTIITIIIKKYNNSNNNSNDNDNNK